MHFKRNGCNPKVEKLSGYDDISGTTEMTHVMPTEIHECSALKGIEDLSQFVWRDGLCFMM